MAYVTGEVIPTPAEGHPFKVVFKQGDDVLEEWPVASQEEGEAQIVETLHEIGRRAREEGYKRCPPDRKAKNAPPM